jgi:hypothetical protein
LAKLDALAAPIAVAAVLLCAHLATTALAIPTGLVAGNGQLDSLAIVHILEGHLDGMNDVLSLLRTPATPSACGWVGLGWEERMKVCEKSTFRQT